MDNKIIISKSKLIKSLNFSESNRLILGTSGEGQPIHWKREMIMDEYANIGAAKISDNDKWIVINSDSNELTFVPKDKNDTELVICKNVCLKKNGEDTYVLLIFQKWKNSSVIRGLCRFPFLLTRKAYRLIRIPAG